MIFSRRLLVVILFLFITIVSITIYSPRVSRESLSRLPHVVGQKMGLGEWTSSHLRFSLDEPIDPVYIPSPVYFPGVAKAVGESYSRVLVIAKTKKEDTSWMDDEIPEVDKVLYVADDPTAEFHPPENKGHEVMIYLTYIIDHYDSLADVTMFMHAHRWTWHNNDVLNLDAMQMVKRLSSERVTREGYMNMRCQWFPGCPDWMHPGETESDAQKNEQILIARAWTELFPLDPVPKVLAQPCCAQFALSRERIRSIPLERFVFYRNWLLTTKLKDFVSGRVWEYMWQFVFTGESFWCPAEHACYCDGYGICFGGKQQYDDWFDLRNERNGLDRQLKTWQDKRKELVELTEKTAENERVEDKEILLKESPEGLDEQLKSRISVMDNELNQRAIKAAYRGNDPRNRAMEAGREWKEGDGF